MRSYGQKFLLELRDANPIKLGVQLGRLCVDNNIPAVYVAKVLKVSKTTVYAWFRGQSVREENRKTIEVFIDLVKKDAEDGKLPAKNTLDAKLYIESMVGESI